MPMFSAHKIPVLILALVATHAMAQDQNCSLPESDTPASCKPKVCAIKTAHRNNRYLVNRDVYRGWKLFRTYCHACHLEEPHEKIKLDKKRSSPFYLVSQVKGEALSYERFEKVVRDGSLSSAGWMPAWKRNRLVAPSLKQIYAYLEVRANCDLPYMIDQRLAVFDERYLGSP